MLTAIFLAVKNNLSGIDLWLIRQSGKEKKGVIQ
jgi:hypothetical protein